MRVEVSGFGDLPQGIAHPFFGSRVQSKVQGSELRVEKMRVRIQDSGLGVESWKT